MALVPLFAVASHALAAVAFAVVAVLALQRRRGGMLAAALLLTALWAAAVAVRGPGSGAGTVAEALRNIGWLLWLAAPQPGVRAPLGVRALVAALIVVSAGRVLVDGMARPALPSSEVIVALALIGAVGRLILVNAVYAAVDAADRPRIAGALAGLAAMWGYDLALHSVAFVTHEPSGALVAARGLAVALCAAAFVPTARAITPRPFAMSRAGVLRGVALSAGAGYVMLVLALSALLDRFGGQDLALLQIGLLIAATAGAIVVLPSRRARALLKVFVAKHLFSHRYDYRTEWQRFSATLGVADGDAPLEQRAIKAVADIVQAQGGLLLSAVRSGDAATILEPVATWHWPHAQPHGSAALATLLERGWIVALDAVRAGTAGEHAEAVDPGFVDLASAWAIVPLLHRDVLAGAVVLAAPIVTRALDWEDFDLLRVAGGQVAGALAEATSVAALGDAQAFGEFNRRFAFVMHDIKNLVSQLALLARNAERHADNPAFRADMIATLNASTARMNDLLARLAQHHSGRAPPDPSWVVLGDIAQRVSRALSPQHPVVVIGDATLDGAADPARLETALTHLVQNAVDASIAVATSEPVTIVIAAHGANARLTIVDRGAGMSSAFMARDLFRPFASSKPDGFGIGALEARTLIVAMGGVLGVESRVGSGTRFVIDLPRTPSARTGRALAELAA